MTELTVHASVQAPVDILAVMDAYSRPGRTMTPARIASLHTEDTTFHMHLGTPPVQRSWLAMQDACTDIFAMYKNLHRGDPPGHLR